MTNQVDALLSQITTWAREQPNVLALALVGSYARGTARADSDVDLVLVCEVPSILLDDTRWVHQFGEVVGTRHGDYGLVQSKHVQYQLDLENILLEVEFGITSAIWTATNPPDRATCYCVLDGMRTLYDPGERLHPLEAACHKLTTSDNLS